MAEVLITLGIIGVVVALTMPTLVNRIQNKQLEVAFKKQYSMLSQVLQLMYANGECTSSDCISRETFFRTLGRKYSKSVKECKRDELGCFNWSRDYRYKNYPKKSSYIVSDNLDDIGMYLVDGALITFSAGDIGMDVNGYFKGPNALGHDVFVFRIQDKGGMFFLVPKDGLCSRKQVNNAYNGLGCAKNALSETDYFKNLPR